MCELVSLEASQMAALTGTNPLPAIGTPATASVEQTTALAPAPEIWLALMMVREDWAEPTASLFRSKADAIAHIAAQCREMDDDLEEENTVAIEDFFETNVGSWSVTQATIAPLGQSNP